MDNKTTRIHSIDNTQRNITIPILVIFAFPAFICFLFISYHAIKLRKRLMFDTINNHIIFLLLTVDFLSIATELPITLYYLGYGSVHTVKICLFWMYWDCTLQVTSLLITTYVSIERYLLVFHRHTIQKHEFFLHHIPMFCFTIYIPVLYLYLIVFVPCQQESLFDVTAFTCGMPCYFHYVWASTYDALADLLLPCLIILTCNVLIILRVVASRTVALESAPLRRISKKNRRMILQLLGISLMSLTIWLPWIVITIGEDFFDPLFGDWFATYILEYLRYITISMSPFFALIGLPEIRKQFKFRGLTTQIAPS